MATARGTFEIDLIPADSGVDSIAAMSFDKTFTGDLVAMSEGRMLAIRTDAEGSAGYVALELVQGSLGKLTGSFVLQHHGVMNRGESSLDLLVVPDSGTGDYLDLRGTMTIEIVDGVHHYAFEQFLGDDPIGR